MRARTMVAVSLGAVLTVAVPARADSLLTPCVGANLNGTNPMTSVVNFDLGHLNFTRASVGVTFRY